MSREKCPKCLFIQKRCLCKSLIELDSPIPIFIIQYPKEEKHALNTVNILKLNLKPLTIFNTEFIDREKQFREVIKNFKNPILIFPTPQALELVKQLMLLFLSMEAGINVREFIFNLIF